MELRTSTVKSVDAHESDSWLFVCRTCIRDEPFAPNEQSKGSVIASRLRALLSDANLNDRFRIRVVSCLNGCVNPCNISFRGKGKYSFRFGGLAPGDEPAIIAFAEAYVSYEHGCVPAEKWGEPLRTKLSSKIAPPGLSQTN